MERYIGQISRGRNVRISADSPNDHMIITGISGSGKSFRVADIEKHIVEDGGTVLALDLNGTHSEIDKTICRYIVLQEDGININIFDLSLVDAGKESMTNFIEFVMEMLCPRQLRGNCQIAAMRKAITFAIENKDAFSSDMEAIAHGLTEQKENAAIGVYNYLCPILKGDIFRNSASKIEKNKINILSLQGLNARTQKQIVEILLNVLWKKIRVAGAGERHLTIVLDEFQAYDLQRGTALFQMLTEARKYGIGLLLATQTLSVFSRKELAAINQISTKLFFRQSMSDVKKSADLIDFKCREKWVYELERLHVGQAIAIGALEMGGHGISRPVMTYSSCEHELLK